MKYKKEFGPTGLIDLMAFKAECRKNRVSIDIGKYHGQFSQTTHFILTNDDGNTYEILTDTFDYTQIWDNAISWVIASDRNLEKHVSPRGFSAVGLYQPKTPVNIAAALRACCCYDAAFIATTGKRYKKHSADTTSQYKHMPLLHTDDLSTVIPYDCVPVAVELIDGARSLPTYTHPERAFYIFGPEDGSLGKSVTKWCRDTIYIPTQHCMNLAATVNVVLYDRMSKQLK